MDNVEWLLWIRQASGVPREPVPSRTASNADVEGANVAPDVRSDADVSRTDSAILSEAAENTSFQSPAVGEHAILTRRITAEDVKVRRHLYLK
jgi:hypothetical protein